MGENTNVILVIFGLLLAAASTIIEKLSPADKIMTRTILVVTAIIGFGVTAYATWRQDVENRQQQQQTAAADAQIGQLMDPNHGVFIEIDTKLSAIQAAVAAAAPSQGANSLKTIPPVRDEYFVQIAASGSADSLQTLAQKLEKTYNLSSDFVAIVNIPGPFPYKLAFGQHLDKMTAEKYASVANNLGLPPPGQSAYVRPQPK